MTDKSDSGEDDDYESEEDNENEDDEESEDSSEDSQKSEKTSDDCESEEEFKARSDDDEYESESTELLPKNLTVTGASVNTDPEKDKKPNKDVHLRIEDINFTDSSLNNSSKFTATTADLSANADVLINE